MISKLEIYGGIKMINRSQFEQEIIKYSNMPYVATARGYWIDSNKQIIQLDKMSTTYLKSCYDELKIKNNARVELGHLAKYMQEKVDTTNKAEFIDYLNKLIAKKIKEVELELEKR